MRPSAGGVWPLALTWHRKRKNAQIARSGRPVRGWCLPARAVIAAAATSLLLEAVAAVDGFVAARLERHTRLAPARRAGGRVHLTRRAIALVPATPAGHGCLTRGTALRAARGGVREPATHVELLFAGREHEVTSALATPKCLIGGQTCYLPSGHTRASCELTTGVRATSLQTDPTLGRTL